MATRLCRDAERRYMPPCRRHGKYNKIHAEALLCQFFDVAALLLPLRAAYLMPHAITPLYAMAISSPPPFCRYAA